MSRGLMLSPLREVLDQGLILLESLDDASFTTKIPKASNASIGAHYRHCLDHFVSLLEGIDDGFIDYDARRRDPILETDRAAAAELTRSLLQKAKKIDQHDPRQTVRIRCKISYESQDVPTLDSHVDREIMFCISHAIHHYALIGMMCRLLEIPLPEGFGVAPSTIKHQREMATLAA
jgi:hypothetical protein